MTGQTYKLQHFTCNASMIKIRPHNDGFSSNYILLGVMGGVFILFSNFIIIITYMYGIPTLFPNWLAA